MPAWQQHRLRWIALVTGVVVVALLIALAVHVNALLQPQRFTNLLENDLASVGVNLELQAPAQPALFPRPAVRMQGFSLTNQGSSTPILQASGATIVVPWRALLHGEVAIERVEVEAPRIDLGELKTLLARLPHHRGPPRLPTIVTGVHMSQGTLTDHGTPLLFELGVDTGELVPGRRFQMDVSARSADGHRITASLATVPSSPHDGTIDLDPLQLAFSKHGGVSLQLDGQGHWQGGETFAMQLNGSLRHPSFAPPPPAPSAAPAGSAPPTSQPANGSGTTTDKIALSIQPARGKTPITIALKLDGNDAHVDLKLQPTEFGDWWQRLLASSPDHPPGPLPFTGQAQVQKLDLGWLQATGLRIDADPNLAPASAASVAAPASATSTAH
ncbi:MAG: AsmA family protein [Rhodanobacteraceae bacterium]